MSVVCRVLKPVQIGLVILFMVLGSESSRVVGITAEHKKFIIFDKQIADLTQQITDIQKIRVSKYYSRIKALEVRRELMQKQLSAMKARIKNEPIERHVTMFINEWQSAQQKSGMAKSHVRSKSSQAEESIAAAERELRDLMFIFKSLLEVYGKEVFDKVIAKQKRGKNSEYYENLIKKYLDGLQEQKRKLLTK